MAFDGNNLLWFTYMKEGQEKTVGLKFSSLGELYRYVDKKADEVGRHNIKYIIVNFIAVVPLKR
jgi:hypothetical protein